jgi:hypothetical protein
MGKRIVVAVLGVLGGSMAADAESVTYDFTGTGYFCPLDSTGSVSGCTFDVAYTGTIRIDVLAPLPSGVGSFIGSHAAFDPDGWVDSDFIIRWDSNSFSPEPTPGLPFDSPRHSGFVQNDFFGVDLLENTELFAGLSEAREYRSLAVMTRRTSDTSWLNDLSFDLTVGLAPIADGGVNDRNVISFNNFSFNRTTQDDWRGYIGQVQLTSLTPRKTVDIDIKPGSAPNSINPRNKGVIPVAVLGSAEFDATQVDSSTVQFGPNNASPARDGKVTDVNDDGFIDMLFHFRTQATGIACGSNTASLSGKTFGDETFVGSDSIRTVGCKP